MAHLLIENRRGLILDARTTHATGRAERETADAMIQAATRARRATLGSDKAYDAAEHIARLRAMPSVPAGVAGGRQQDGQDRLGGDGAARGLSQTGPGCCGVTG